mgnify:FL=1
MKRTKVAHGGVNGDRGSTAVVERAGEGGSDLGDVGSSDTEGLGRKSDLGDEVSHLSRVQDHEPANASALAPSRGNGWSGRNALVDVVHRAVSGVGRESGHANLGASKEESEELVEVGEEEAAREDSDQRPALRTSLRE